MVRTTRVTVFLPLKLNKKTTLVSTSSWVGDSQRVLTYIKFKWKKTTN